MLIIISDLHLGDGTCGKSISKSAFDLFADRLRELARNASWRTDGRYQPVNEIDILMLGDILEVQHSARWLEKKAGEPGYVRPWSDQNSPEFAAKVDEITASVLENNRASIAVLRDLTRPAGLTLPCAGPLGRPDEESPQQHSVRVRIHYMIGNHDWFYHLSGAPMDKVRDRVIDAFGLTNPRHRFPYNINESGAKWLKFLLGEYGVFARHGDIYDSFNFNKKRDQASLGDVFAIEVLNRFALEARRQFEDKLPAQIIDSLSELVNVRPALATPLWISSHLRQNNVNDKIQKEIKELWDDLCRQFLKQPLVCKVDKKYRLDLVDWFKFGIFLTDAISFRTLDDLVIWIRQKFLSKEEINFSGYALKEKAFREHAAQYIVYGHTHHHEVVPLDDIPTTPHPTSQLYMNSGTWHTYYDLAINKPEEQKFIPYQVLTYLAFFQGDERGGRHFETWSGSFSE